jgi:hypothetical protein
MERSACKQLFKQASHRGIPQVCRRNGISMGKAIVDGLDSSRIEAGGAHVALQDSRAHRSTQSAKAGLSLSEGMYRHIRAAYSGKIQSSRYRTRYSSLAHMLRSVKTRCFVDMSCDAVMSSACAISKESSGREDRVLSPQVA